MQALVMVAGSARRFAQISIDQNRYLAAGMEPSEELDRQIAAVVAFFQSILRHEVPPETMVQPGLPVAYYYAVDEYQPIDHLPTFDGPVLVTQGGADFQALPDADYTVLEEAFGDDPAYTFRLFDELNHLLMVAQNPEAGMADYANPGHVDENLLAFVAEWISKLD